MPPKLSKRPQAVINNVQIPSPCQVHAKSLPDRKIRQRCLPTMVNHNQGWSGGGSPAWGVFDKTGRMNNHSQSQKLKKEPGPKAENGTRAQGGGALGAQDFFVRAPPARRSSRKRSGAPDGPLLFLAFPEKLILKAFGHGLPQHISKAALYLFSKLGSAMESSGVSKIRVTILHALVCT